MTMYTSSEDSLLCLFLNVVVGNIKLSNDQGVREAAKKKVPPLVAGPLRGGGGKGRATKEKTFFYFVAI